GGVGRWWGVATGKGRGKFPTPSPSRAVALSPDGRLVLTDGEGGTMRLWDVAEVPGVGPPEGREHRRHELAEVGQALALSPDGRRVAHGLLSLRVLDLSTQKLGPALREGNS